MSRVYEALKRAAENGADTTPTKPSTTPTPTHEPTVVANNSSGRTTSTSVTKKNGNGVETPDKIFSRSSIFAPEATAQTTSAFNERTDSTTAGKALSGGSAMRDAGATLNAGSSTRTPEFLSHEISAARVEPHLIAVTQPRSSYCEQFRSLRTRVLHAHERHQMQAFVITSANVMEGKTLTSLNLSWLLAQTDGVRALLIDGDLRHPCAADYLGIDAPVGLSEVLAGEANLADTIMRLEPAGLHLLPGGTARDGVAELISGPRFNNVLSELRRTFDYIIIDAPPLGLFTDAAVLINRADGVLLVVRAGRTKYGELNRLLEPLPRERMLGVVMNGSDEPMNAHNDYYQRRYYKRDETVFTEAKHKEEITVS